VRVADIDGNVGVAFLHTVVDHSPDFGKLLVSPQRGAAASTDFYAVATEWTDRPPGTPSRRPCLKSGESARRAVKVPIARFSSLKSHGSVQSRPGCPSGRGCWACMSRTPWVPSTICPAHPQ
jgi:hypothetical protein